MVSFNREKKESFKVSIWVLILTNILVLQLSGFFSQSDNYRLAEGEVVKAYYGNNEDKNVVAAVGATNAGEDAIVNPLEIPRGKALALPSVRINDSSAGYQRRGYGGKGDKPHLGGFATNSVDFEGISPKLWRYMIDEIGIKSLLDVGCGRGISTSWFHLHGVETLCVEGSHDAIEQSVLPAGVVTEHDFSRGPWWPPRTVDAIWCVELLEHIGRNFHKNLIPAFRKAAIIYATHSTWGGWHHVEVHDSEWWIAKFESYGFRYSPTLTEKAKQMAMQGKNEASPVGKKYNAQHLWLHVMVFINPTVAALPEHHHLFAEGGCYDNFEKDARGNRKIIHRKCGTGNQEQQETESVLPDFFNPLQINQSMDEAWEKLVFRDMQ